MTTKTRILALLPLLAACSSTQPAAPPAATADASAIDAPADDDGGTIAADGGAGIDAAALAGRPYKPVVPPKYDPAKPTPLVVLLHGYTSSGANQESYFKLAAVAAAETFLYAYPDGTTDKNGSRFWNAGGACCNFFGSKVDDVAYLTAIVDDMSARYNVDPKRVYFVGHSNGGFMAHRMACELSRRVAAIVSLAGTMESPPACKAPSPVAVLQVHGDADATVSYAGGTLVAGAASYLGAKEAVAAWAGKNGCGASPLPSTETLDLDVGLAGAETNVERHACTAGAAELWTIRGGAHIPQFQATWAGLVWGFLKAHPRP
jgi:polyhydroxybutyrate depolymerase